MNIIRSLAFFIATSLVAMAAPPKAVNPDTIKDKVSITLGQEFHIKFKPERDQLLQPTKHNGKGDGKSSVRVKLSVTKHSPFPPPRKGATRPYLSVENGFEKTLSCRALARHKGSKEFFDISEDFKAIDPGDGWNKCWDFDSLVEEVVLYQFTLSQKPSK